MFMSKKQRRILAALTEGYEILQVVPAGVMLVMRVHRPHADTSRYIDSYDYWICAARDFHRLYNAGWILPELPPGEAWHLLSLWHITDAGRAALVG